MFRKQPQPPEDPTQMADEKLAAELEKIVQKYDHSQRRSDTIFGWSALPSIAAMFLGSIWGAWAISSGVIMTTLALAAGVVLGGVVSIVAGIAGVGYCAFSLTDRYYRPDIDNFYNRKPLLAAEQKKRADEKQAREQKAQATALLAILTASLAKKRALADDLDQIQNGLWEPLRINPPARIARRGMTP